MTTTATELGPVFHLPEATLWFESGPYRATDGDVWSNGWVSWTASSGLRESTPPWGGLFRIDGVEFPGSSPE